MPDTNPFDVYLSTQEGSAEQLVAEKEIAELWQQLVMNQYNADKNFRKALLKSERLVSVIGKGRDYGNIFRNELIEQGILMIAIKMIIERQVQFGGAFHDQPGGLIVSTVVQLTRKLVGYVSKLALPAK